MPVRVAVNGFGRVGRAALRAALERELDLEWVAINDLVDAETLAYLLAHDSVYGRFPGVVEASQDAITVDGHDIRVFAEADPAALPWAELGVDVVIESTGKFRTRAHTTLAAQGGKR
jgi:glyceraldehyde 3-phosphate dehydrogenase